MHLQVQLATLKRQVAQQKDIFHSMQAEVGKVCHPPGSTLTPAVVDLVIHEIMLASPGIVSKEAQCQTSCN